jgi:hypothetical protein
MKLGLSFLRKTQKDALTFYDEVPLCVYMSVVQAIPTFEA